MTKWILYIIFIKPGFMATAYTSYWSLESCMDAADTAQRTHYEEVNFVSCIPEKRATETFFSTHGLEQVEKDVKEMEEVLDGDPDL